jgi:hypothetical protein
MTSFARYNTHMDYSKLQIHDDKYKKFLLGKRIAIVGPSQSAFLDKNGEYINNFDVVVRVNRGIELINDNEMFIGDKTDVLYNSLDFNIVSGGHLSGIDDKLKFICCPYSIEEGTYNHANVFPIFDKYNIRFINSSIYNQIKSKSRSRINTGFGAIIDLLQHDFEQLFITGLDFYRSLYHESYNPEKSMKTVKDIEDDLEIFTYDDTEHHNPDRQYLCFKKMIENDSRIVLDSFMSEIITDKRYDSWKTIPRL